MSGDYESFGFGHEDDVSAFGAPTPSPGSPVVSVTSSKKNKKNASAAATAAKGEGSDANHRPTSSSKRFRGLFEKRTVADASSLRQQSNPNGSEKKTSGADEAINLEDGVSVHSGHSYPLPQYGAEAADASAAAAVVAMDKGHHPQPAKKAGATTAAAAADGGPPRPLSPSSLAQRRLPPRLRVQSFVDPPVQWDQQQHTPMLSLGVPDYVRSGSVSPIAESVKSDGQSPRNGALARGGSLHGAALENPGAASFLDQLFAVLQRSFQQMMKNFSGLLVELIAPLLFIVIAVALWAVWGTAKSGEKTYVNYEIANMANPLVNDTYFQQLLCYNDAVGPVPGFKPCSSYEDAGSPLRCDGDFALTPFPDAALCSTQHNTSLSDVVISYAALTVGNMLRLPSLDNTLLAHWLATAVRVDLEELTAFSFSGLIPNSMYSSILCGGSLYLVGPSSVTSAAWTYISANSKFAAYAYGGQYPTLSMAQQQIALLSGNLTWMIVEFRSFTKEKMDVVMHVNNSALPSFGITFDKAYPGGAEFSSAELYVLSGYATMQKVISEFYFEAVHGEVVDATVYLSSMAHPPFNRVPLLLQARNACSLLFALAFLFTVSQQTKKIVLEKELRIREAMLIMGMGEAALYLAEFVIQFVKLFVVSVIAALLLRLTFITNSNPLMVFLLFFLFGVTTIPLSGLIAAFFSKARLASLMSPVIYFILVIPMFATSNVSGAFVVGFSVLSPSAFAAALNSFLEHEVSGGFVRDDFTSTQSNPTLAIILCMMVADIGIYYILYLYLDAVLPKDWGTSKHPLFFIIDPIRACLRIQPGKLQGGKDGRAQNGVFEDTVYSDDVVYISGLRKEFKRGGKTFVAVNNFYWGMREGEISVLLGHNGAGKTTVLNMMTGMMEPDEGDCYVYGSSVRRQLETVRCQIGFCPQHNILWPELTCRDHLEFFGQVKGLKGWELEEAVCRMLYETDLLEKMDQPASSLSGGQKRRLSISIAFAGGSRLVFLDEPTAGLDVGARRHVWELLKRMARSRTILLTTHYMDEADLLGQRIGIMSQGRLKCSGSSLFLKSNLGVGYSMAISVVPEQDQNAIDELVVGTVTGADVLGHNGCELTYRLPQSSVLQFPALLNAIEARQNDGIRGYSLAATTLEEVFLKVSEEDLLNRVANDDDRENIRPVWECDFDDAHFSAQFKATMTKRFWNAMRDRRMQCFQIVCPVVCILIAMLLNLVSYENPQSLVLNYTMFKGQPESVVQNAQCDTVFGTSASWPAVVLNETHYGSAQQLDWFLLDTWHGHSSPRYGAIACNDVELTYAELYLGSQVSNATYMLYNTSSRHQVGLNMAMYYDLLLSRVTEGKSTMQFTGATFNPPSTQDALTFTLIGALLMIPFTFLPSNPVAWVVKERECGARHLQNLCGLSFYVYWLCNFIFDLCAYLISMLLCILIFAIFNRQEFIGADRVGGTVMLLFLFGLTSTVCAYSLSFIFKEHSTAQTVVMGAGFVAGFLCLVIVYVMNLKPEAVDTSETLRWVFRAIPTYCVGEGITNMLMLDANIQIGKAHGVWDMDQLGWTLVYLACEFPVFSLLTLALDSPGFRRWWQKRKYDRHEKLDVPDDEDSDVEDEREAVHEAERTDDHTDVVRVVDLQKRYGNGKLAVRGITFSIFPGEVFGFLGTNGAGKTTTISMLCQQFLPTGGTAYVCGYDIVEESREALACIGYCPQFDATLDLLTVEEHLYLYAAVRGIVKAQQKGVVDALIVLCELTMYRKTVASKLSGGNRRKLSVALSLIGGPKVVFLDEPSAGMDPVARRGMWTAIQKASKHCSVVLTTHHLEEVEALSEMVAIMVDGQLRCIGDKIHLKNKYGSGYELSMRLSSPEYGVALTEFMTERFPGCILNEHDERRYVYQLPKQFTFAEIFDVVGNQNVRLGITDYSVSQTSIEQIFLRVSEMAKASKK